MWAQGSICSGHVFDPKTTIRLGGEMLKNVVCADGQSWAIGIPTVFKNSFDPG